VAGLCAQDVDSFFLSTCLPPPPWVFNNRFSCLMTPVYSLSSILVSAWHMGRRAVTFCGRTHGEGYAGHHLRPSFKWRSLFPRLPLRNLVKSSVWSRFAFLVFPYIFFLENYR